MSKLLTLEKTLKWPLLLLAFTPLAVTNNTLFPFVFGKTVFIRTGVTLFWLTLAVYLIAGGKLGVPHWRRYLRHPVFVATAIFLLLALASTFLSVNPYRSFFGDVERGEGLLNLLFFTGFFVGSLLVFEKKDWLLFMKLSLVTGAVLALDLVWRFVGGGSRPQGDFLGNASFIAAYMFFAIFAAWLVRVWEKNRVWLLAAGATIVLAILTVLLTETRGAALGLVGGFIAVMLFLTVFGKGLALKRFPKLDWRTSGMVAVALAIGFGVLFGATIRNPIWERVPGLNRLASLTEDDRTLETRIISMGVSLEAMNPANEGAVRTLFGWGPDSFELAYNAHYNPDFINESVEWFDKAHNQIFDVLVTNGLLGLVAYLYLWGAAVWSYARYVTGREADEGTKAERIWLGAGAVFFTVGYFTQNMALFDQISSYVPLFAFFAVGAFLTPHLARGRGEGTTGSILGRLARYGVAALALFMLTMLVSQTYIPYNQMQTFIRDERTSNAGNIYRDLEKITKPYTYAQMELRWQIYLLLPSLLGNPEASGFVDRGYDLFKEALDREPYSARFYMSFGTLPTTRSRLYADDRYMTYLGEGETSLRKALALAPGRQEVVMVLANNLVHQGRFAEAEQLMADMLAQTPAAPIARYYYAITIAPHNYENSDNALAMLQAVFFDSGVKPKFTNLNNMRQMYTTYLLRAYRDQNEDDFLFTLKRAIELERLADRVNQKWVADGYLKTAPVSLAGHLEQGLSAFERSGWEGVSLGSF